MTFPSLFLGASLHGAWASSASVLWLSQVSSLERRQCFRGEDGQLLATVIEMGVQEGHDHFVLAISRRALTHSCAGTWWQQRSCSDILVTPRKRRSSTCGFHLGIVLPCLARPIGVAERFFVKEPSAFLASGIQSPQYMSSSRKLLRNYRNANARSQISRGDP